MRALHFALPMMFALIQAGCAGSRAHAPATAAMETAPLPESPHEARAEIARLEREIQLSRQGLGLAVAPPAPGPMAQDGVQAGAVSEAEADESPAPESAPVSRSEGWQSDGRDTCSEPCKLSRAICKAARRICKIADYLGEDAARGKCQRARADCKEARGKAGKCMGCKP